MKQKIRQFLSFILVRLLRINPDSLLYFAYFTNNIRPGHDLSKNGELYLIQKVGRFNKSERQLILFDVGANEGAYSRLLSSNIPSAKIYAFEPNHELVKHSDYASAAVFQIGLGEKKMQANLYVNEGALQEASIFKGVAEHLAYDQKGANIKALDINIETLDAFCIQHNIAGIDLLKIDTEGNEHAVLLGAREMLAADKIKIIQFEFNEMNVISRVFLKDFYDLLSPQYELFRLHKDALFPLGSYKSHNEIFVWHNLVAINKTILRPFLQIP